MFSVLPSKFQWFSSTEHLHTYVPKAPAGHHDHTAVNMPLTMQVFDKLEFLSDDSQSHTEGSSSYLQLIIFFFHGLLRDGKYDENWNSLHWLRRIVQNHPGTDVYAASYEQYRVKHGGLGQVDLYALGEILLDGILKVREELAAKWETSHVILVGHSVGGLAIKQLILQAESRAQFTTRESHKDPSLSFLNRVTGIFYLSTPHSDSADLTRLLGLKDHLGRALAALGKVPQRLNHQFKERRKALRIPTAEVFELCPTKVGSFNDIVVPEASARMDVDVAIGVPMDHFSILMMKLEDKIGHGQTSYNFLEAQIQEWVEEKKRKEKLDQKNSIEEVDEGGEATEAN